MSAMTSSRLVLQCFEVIETMSGNNGDHTVLGARVFSNAAGERVNTLARSTSNTGPVEPKFAVRS